MAVHYFRDYKHLAREYYDGKTFVAFDTETTGLKCESDFLLEIGAVKFNCNGVMGESYDQLIKPPLAIPSYIQELTHISNSMVFSKPSVEEILPDFLKFLGGKDVILVAHNAPFDIGFININLIRSLHSELNNLVIDTLPLSRWAYPELAFAPEKGQYKLQSLAKKFNLEVKAAHRADDDARVCMELMNQILKDTMDRQKDYIIHKKKPDSAQDLQLSLF